MLLTLCSAADASLADRHFTIVKEHLGRPTRTTVTQFAKGATSWASWSGFWGHLEDSAADSTTGVY